MSESSSPDSNRSSPIPKTTGIVPVVFLLQHPGLRLRMVWDMSSNTSPALDRTILTIAAFRQTTGSFPSPVSELASERSLGRWLNARRQENIHGIATDLVIQKLDTHVEDWRVTEAELWVIWARECSDFMLRLEREPSPVGTSEAERELGVWYRSQLSFANLGRLSADRHAWLRDHCRFWAPDPLVTGSTAPAAEAGS